MPAAPESPRFRLVERIDEEPGHSVYVAHDERARTRVQVVSLQHALPAAAAERFGREAKLLAALRHAYIAAVVDHGVGGDGHPYFVREDEGGVSLAQRWTQAPLALDTAWQVGLQIAEALMCLHEHGLSHGAVNARNIRWSDAGVARLLTAPRSDDAAGDRSPRADLAQLGRTLKALMDRDDPAEPVPEPLRRVLELASDVAGHPQLRADELRAAWLAAGMEVWPHKLAATQPVLRPEPQVWPPAPDLVPAPPEQPGCSDAGDASCSASAPPRLYARRLELRTLLGQGKCGQTWRAHHHVLGRDVAVKILPRTLARTPVLADLCREAMALDKLTHRAFPRIYECDYNDDGSWYLVEELIDGEPLARTIQRGPMEPLAAVELVIELAEALQDAHARGILHGDLSFTNLMLERSLPPRPRIIDLSECRFLDAFYARTDQRYAPAPRHRGDDGRAFGHPGFAAPELFRGGAKSERSDVYSLGAVLFMLITGAQMPNAVIRELLAAEPAEGAARLREHVVRAAPQLEDTFLAADFQDILAQDPELRVKSMADLLELLRAERDALRSLHSDRGERTAPPAASTGSRPRAAAPVSAPAAAWTDMSSQTAARPRARRLGWALAAAAFGVAGFFVMSSETGSDAPAARDAPAPAKAAPRADPPPTAAPRPGPTRAEVVAAVEALAPRLRACPGAPRRLALALEAGGPTRLLEIQHLSVDERHPLDRCIREAIASLQFEGAPVRHALTIDLGG
ncbi:Serine/threonine protein kinase [Nannocystis exedens]|uniref:Serine/threonine protein kinase n=1 Tax=Nannocystis exedens TaxID=54 RepID=A0A1I2BGA7_9BACT|nr:serine/threonine-protein kinase [Nannocystis exedens]PCC67994.1 Serine/threonine-protein kinase PknB [Nannocystis exedens]SFE55089.1 Serine/threonine protein kinase [Nannocystis exedens]